jgi:hypothetical protein
MLNKKGQLQINETVIVLFIFSIIFIIGLVALSNYMDRVVDRDLELIQAERFETLFFTSIDFSIKCADRSVCVDGLKLLYYETDDYTLNFKQIYPEVEEFISCTEENYPKCNSYSFGEVREEGYVLRTPVLLYEPLSGDYKSYLMEVKQ